MGRSTLLFWELAVIATLGCGGRPASETAAPETAAQAAAALSVENLGYPDVTVYAIGPAGNRVRLGQVSGHSTQRLVLPAYLVRGGERLRFLADPIGGGRAPVSEELYVAPGELVTLIIPPR